MRCKNRSCGCCFSSAFRICLHFLPVFGPSRGVGREYIYIYIYIYIYSVKSAILITGIWNSTSQPWVDNERSEHTPVDSGVRLWFLMTGCGGGRMQKVAVQSDSFVTMLYHQYCYRSMDSYRFTTWEPASITTTLSTRIIQVPSTEKTMGMRKVMIRKKRSQNALTLPSTSYLHKSINQSINQSTSAPNDD